MGAAQQLHEQVCVDRIIAEGVVDLAAISGYYTFLAMELNAARYPIPADGKPLPRMPE